MVRVIYNFYFYIKEEPLTEAAEEEEVCKISQTHTTLLT